ncbi:unnamed protein product (macronuclear) [Paramecium tetraurelia]|uniref:COPA/B second beta-propeller domain-containing protein n=1 Tax=Paramecium tetraurelia TaxID=5888 RepID=A0DZB5_PARTE|nr:uncharacterized protein GSPATT00003351001 [Paramecium tetraurelia]CAK88382.1 unnamed protein product [Paramecium tetraurelia]|eukprot:XP_001455779.1 hypothetical protein (macronuclear) [Paramecium tetraurelia strain d4-2]
MFYDWETGKLIRRIDFFPNKVILNDTNTIVALATNDEVAITNLLQQEENSDGFEDAFQPLCDTTESINSGYFIQDVFYYTTMNGKIAYSVNGKIFIVDQDKKYFIIRYIQQQNKLYLIDKKYNIISYEVNSNVVEFQTRILKKQCTKAEETLQTIPIQYYDKLSKFQTLLISKNGHINQSRTKTINLSLLFNLHLQMMLSQLLKKAKTHSNQDKLEIFLQNKEKLKQLLKPCNRQMILEDSYKFIPLWD